VLLPADGCIGNITCKSPAPTNPSDKPHPLPSCVGVDVSMVVTGSATKSSLLNACGVSGDCINEFSMLVADRVSVQTEAITQFY
jgi:hypothetical protein